MHKIEAKVLGIDRAAVESTLNQLGARPGPEERFAASFFDFPDGRLRARGHLLRLRREGDRNVLTHKRRVAESGVKVREETELEISDFEACRRVLHTLGPVETTHVDKFRTSYRLGSASIAIDRHVGELAFIPELLEIEAGSVEDVRSVAARLGSSPEQLGPWGLSQLADHDRRLG